MTGSGKTTLGKQLIKAYKNKGIKTLVLDPLNDPDWNADFQTDNNDEFLSKVFHPESRSCALFIDESGTAIGRYSGTMQRIATQSRHLGHKAHFFTQRGTQLDRTIRDQCSTLFLFTSSSVDGKTYAEEFGWEELKNTRELKRGEAFKVERFSPPQKINVFSS